MDTKEKKKKRRYSTDLGDADLEVIAPFIGISHVAWLGSIQHECSDNSRRIRAGQCWDEAIQNIVPSDPFLSLGVCLSMIAILSQVIKDLQDEQTLIRIASAENKP